MPHDKHGKLIEVGDEVVLRGKVTQVSAGEEYCNVTIETAPMFPHTELGIMSAINTRQLELVGKGPKAMAEVEPPPDGPGTGPS